MSDLFWLRSACKLIGGIQNEGNSKKKNGNATGTGNICYIDLWPNEMMHWKYLKREKLPNGKFRYWYDRESLKKDVNTRLGISAKEQMDKDMQNLLATKERLRTLQNMANKDKALSLKYEQEIADLTKKVSDADFEAGYEKGVVHEYAKKLVEQHPDNILDAPKEDLESYSTMYNRAQELKSKADNYKADLARTNRTYSAIKNNMYKNEKTMAYMERAIKQLENSYINQKSIYDKSIAGRIDRGKQFVQKLLQKLKW